MGLLSKSISVRKIMAIIDKRASDLKEGYDECDTEDKMIISETCLELAELKYDIVELLESMEGEDL